jgi:hypothetical protein
MRPSTLMIEAYPLLRAMSEQEEVHHTADTARESRSGWAVRAARRLFRPALRIRAGSAPSGARAGGGS